MSNDKYKRHFSFKMPHNKTLSLDSTGNGYKQPRRYRVAIGQDLNAGGMSVHQQILSEFSYNDLMRLNQAIHQILSSNNNEHAFVKWYNNKASRAVARAKPKLKLINRKRGQ